MTEEKSDKENVSSVDEKKKPSNKQMYSAMSFAVMFVLVGIPLWWKTTEVYRVSLPYAEIDILEDELFFFTVDVRIATLQKDKGLKLVEDLNELLRNSKFFKVSFDIITSPKALLGNCKNLSEVDEQISHPTSEGSVQLMEVPGLSRFTPQKVIVGKNRTIFFSTDADAITLYQMLQSRFLMENHFNRTLMHVRSPPEGRLDSECSRRVSPAAAYDVLVTVLNPDPEKFTLILDLQKAIEDYVEPLLSELRDLYGLYVKSQWLHMVGLQVKPTLVEGDFKHFALSEAMLPHVITPLEKKLSSHVSKNPCLNFVLWVPPCEMAPLHIYSSAEQRVAGRDAFLSPRWGGIQIANPPSDQCELSNHVEVRPDMKVIMPVFLQQLRLLLGVASVESDIANGYIVPGAVFLRSWEKDFLLKSRTVEQMTIAKHTLQSLSKLLGRISNIVINDHIGEGIYEALTAIQDCETALQDGKLLQAYKFSQKAFVASEAAFTDPSLLALLYFPEDQKYAVYIPLFLPVMIPVLISFKPLREWLVDRFFKST